MNNFSNVGKWAVVGVIAVVIIVLAVVYGGSNGNNSTGQPSSNTSGSGAETASTTATTQTASGTTAATGGTGVTVVTRPPTPVIHIITPVDNDQWKLNTQNPITWDKEGGVTGEVELIDAKTKAVIGVIISETGPHQTSYTWDTRQVYLARYNPLKKDIVAGTYQIRIKFDGNNLPTLTSFPFTVSQ